jgi:single-strand DNA-binding protein
MIIVTATGNLGRDPERKSDNAPVKFSIASSRKVKGEEHTVWLNVSVWGKLGEVCLAHLKKGGKVAVSGRLVSDQYEKDGVKRTSWELHANDVEFLGSRPSASDEESSSSSDPTPVPQPADKPTDDIPF